MKALRSSADVVSHVFTEMERSRLAQVLNSSSAAVTVGEGAKVAIDAWLDIFPHDDSHGLYRSKWTRVRFLSFFPSFSYYQIFAK